MLCLLKRTLGVCLIGFGIGVLMVLLLPITGWLFIIGVALCIIGIAWLICWLKKGGIKMKIVVKKVPKFLRGFVKLIFGIKD